MTATVTSTVTPAVTATALAAGGSAPVFSSGSPTATPALVRAGGVPQQSAATSQTPESGTPSGTIRGQSASESGVGALPSAGEGDGSPPMSLKSVMAAAVIVLVAVGSWVYYYGVRQATEED